MKKITSMMLLIGICQFGFTATDSLKRKSDVHTFSMNGEYSTTYLKLSKLKKQIPTYIVDMSYDKWTSQEERKNSLGLLQKHINEEKKAISFPLIIQKKNIQINNFQITNNTREPGNFELSLLGNIKDDSSQFALLKGYVHFPYPFYNTVLKSWIGKTPIQYGITKDRLALKNKGKNLDYFSFTRYGQTSPFQVNTLPPCHIRNLKPFVDNSDANWTPFDLDKSGHQKGSSLSKKNEMSIFEGKFSFADFPLETQEKMAWQNQDFNSRLFIKVNKKHAPGSFLKRHKTRGYQLPKKYFVLENSEMIQYSVKGSFLAKAKNGKEFWSRAKKHKKPIFVPHRFDNYQEMFGALNPKTGILEGGFWTSTDPNILTSSIEADGRYGANQNIDNFKAQRLWPADLDFIQRLSFYDAYVYQYQGGESSLTGQFIPPDQKPRLEIKLSCSKGKKDFCKGKIHNLVIGNISLKPGERKEILPGIGAQPTEESYNKDSLLDFKVYALTYNKQGYITNHFPEIGKVIVTRGLHLNDLENPYSYTIDILSNDRIHVLSRTILNLKSAHIDFERKKVLNGKSVGLK